MYSHNTLLIIAKNRISQISYISFFHSPPSNSAFVCLDTLSLKILHTPLFYVILMSPYGGGSKSLSWKNVCLDSFRSSLSNRIRQTPVNINNIHLIMISHGAHMLHNFYYYIISKKWLYFYQT